MADETIVELKAPGRVALVAVPGELRLVAPGALAEPWVIAVPSLSSATWLSSTEARFRSTTPNAEPCEDDAPVGVGGRRARWDLTLTFGAPAEVPFRRGHGLRTGSLIAWLSPMRSPEGLLPSHNVRKKRATSVRFSAKDGPQALLPLVKIAGLEFPTFGDPS